MTSATLSPPATPGLDLRYWSASEAALILRPDLSHRAVRDRIARAGLTPVARRHSHSRRGTTAPVYKAEDLITLLAGEEKEASSHEAP